MADRSVGQPRHFQIAENVQAALRSGIPVVALESAVITHGLAHPRNLEVALRMEAAVRDENATPATVAVVDGTILIGLADAALRGLAESSSTSKVGARDIATAILMKKSGGTTVASTMLAARSVGVGVLATGGIGGVHRESPFDVSADLRALASTPMIVVSAGAKAVLDIPATLECLETFSVPVVGYKTNEFPAFFSRTSGLDTSCRLDSPTEIAEYWATHRALGMRSAVLVANPIPESHAIPQEEIEEIMIDASSEARRRGIQGQAVTPFLLGRVGEMSSQRSTAANIALLENNARLAAQIAVAVSDQEKRRESEA
jgi:pseudouridine-5'-phosphate glycosidase